jgi:hypothetical protein
MLKKTAVPQLQLPKSMVPGIVHHDNGRAERFFQREQKKIVDSTPNCAYECENAKKAETFREGE